MTNTLAARIGSKHRFPPGEELMLALGLATSDLGALSVEVLERFQLTHPKYNVLRMLAGAGERGLTHGEITRWMVTGVPDVTRLVDGLEARRLVRRERDPSDRRRVRHYVEPAGLKLLREIQPEMTAVHDWIEVALPADQRTALVELCQRVIEAAGRRNRREGFTP